MRNFDSILLFENARRARYGANLYRTYNARRISLPEAEVLVAERKWLLQDRR